MATRSQTALNSSTKINQLNQTGPFEIIGDIHGCADELLLLLDKLGWQSFNTTGQVPWGNASWRHPAGRRAIVLGDLVDRGPRVLDTLCIVHNMVASASAYCVAGNHDVKLARWLRGKDVQLKHGIDRSISELEMLPHNHRSAIAAFLESLPSHHVFDHGRLVVAHAGLREDMHGRDSAAIRAFALYGQTTGETDEYGLPIRQNWAAEYRGHATVVYGHTPIPKPEWLNNAINIDTGAVFGGSLTALRYPERELISVPAVRQYAVPLRPIALNALPRL